MEYVALAGYVFLSLFFIVAGVSKVLDLAGSRDAMKDFGVPKYLAKHLGLLLPIFEIALGAAMLVQSAARLAAIAAAGLLGIFALTIGWHLLHGHKPDCHCFGKLYNSPASWSTVARNLILVVLASWLAANPRGSLSILSIMQEIHMNTLSTTLAVALGVIFVGGAGWIIMHLIRQQGRLLLRIEAIEQQLAATSTVPSSSFSPRASSLGLPVNAHAPVFRLPSLDGSFVSLQDLLQKGKPLILFFMDPGCSPCNAFVPELGQWHKKIGQTVQFIVLTRGDAKAISSKFSAIEVSDILIQKDREIALAYQCAGTPGAVLIRADGLIGSAVAAGLDQMRQLLDQAAVLAQPGRQIHGSLRIGEPAPNFTLPDLDGTLMPLGSLASGMLFLLFWNPLCGFCTAMIDDLRKWEQTQKSSMRLILIAAGTSNQNRVFGLRSTILLDPTFATAAAFGANGTPSGMVVSPGGTVASRLLVGSDAIMSTLRAQSDARLVQPQNA